MKKYKFNELYVVSVIKAIKDPYSSENKVEDCFKKMGISIATKLNDTCYVDVFTNEHYDAISKSTKKGDNLFVLALPFENLIVDETEEQQKVLRNTEWDKTYLTTVLENFNQDYPEFVLSRLQKIDYELDEDFDEDEDIDIAKMN